MNKDAVLKWKNGFEKAQEAEHRLIRKTVVDCERSIRLSLALINLSRKQSTWPPHGEEDKIWQQGVKKVRERWKILKKGLIK